MSPSAPEGGKVLTQAKTSHAVGGCGIARAASPVQDSCSGSPPSPAHHHRGQGTTRRGRAAELGAASHLAVQKVSSPEETFIRTHFLSRLAGHPATPASISGPRSQEPRPGRQNPRPASQPGREPAPAAPDRGGAQLHPGGPSAEPGGREPDPAAAAAPGAPAGPSQPQLGSPADREGEPGGQPQPGHLLPADWYVSGSVWAPLFLLLSAEQSAWLGITVGGLP